jgi:hypothetical protein
MNQNPFSEYFYDVRVSLYEISIRLFLIGLVIVCVPLIAIYFWGVFGSFLACEPVIVCLQLFIHRDLDRFIKDWLEISSDLHINLIAALIWLILIGIAIMIIMVAIKTEMLYLMICTVPIVLAFILGMFICGLLLVVTTTVGN